MVVSDLSYKLDNTISHNGKVGLVLLATDQITLYEFEKIFKNTGILCFPSRVMNSVEIVPEELINIKDELVRAVNTILLGLPLEVVAFSCTSASMVIGEEEVNRIIQKDTHNDRKIKQSTNPFSAIKNACSFLRINKLGLITPYVEEVTLGISEGLAEAGIHTQDAASFKVSNDNIVPDITPESIENAVIAMSKQDHIDTIFISCTNLNICTRIETLEQLTKKRILTSNQVLAWDILRLANYKSSVKGFGKLLELER